MFAGMGGSVTRVAEASGKKTKNKNIWSFIEYRTNFGIGCYGARVGQAPDWVDWMYNNLTNITVYNMNY